MYAPFVFILLTAVLVLLPGWFVFRAAFGRQNGLMPLETLLTSFAFGIGLLDFLMMLLGKFGFRLTPPTLLAGVTLIALAALSLRVWRFRRHPSSADAIVPDDFGFSKKQGYLFVLLLVLTVLIKTIYLAGSLAPTATDLGHHLYWSELIARTGALPTYEKQDIVTDAAGAASVSPPQPIADFIIGEHLPFAAFEIIGKFGFLSAYPVVFLLLVNLFGLLTLVVFTYRLAGGLRSPSGTPFAFSPPIAALAALFLFGPLYSLASPEAKFVSGGVVGNTYGDFFIPLILPFFYRALDEKRSDFLSTGLFLTFTLAYIHHLSTLMLLFALTATATLVLITHVDALTDTLLAWWRLLARPAPLLLLALAGLFFFGVAKPTYIETHAVGTVLGTPTKNTRTGLSFLQVASSTGHARVAFGLAALVILVGWSGRKRYASAFLIGWSGVLLVLTLEPQWLFINIPSDRVGAYVSFPLGILAALALASLLPSFRANGSFRLPPTLLVAFSCIAFAFAAGTGSFDNSQTLVAKNKYPEALQTFAASGYLAARTAPNDLILKDHNYIAADAWIKTFFLRGYFYPFSRGLFERYNNPTHEQCTLRMISVPNTAEGERCYDETGIGYVMVNPAFDTAQFVKSRRFSRVYASDGIDIYRRNPTL